MPKILYKANCMHQRMTAHTYLHNKKRAQCLYSDRAKERMT